jgi:hypothetical protein
VRVDDAMTLPNDRLDPMRELARSIEGLSGRVAMRWRCSPRFGYGREVPRCEWRYGVPVAVSGGAAIGVMSWDAGTPAWRDAGIEAGIEIAAGGRALLALTSAYAEPLIFPGRRDVLTRLETTIGFWQSWSRTHAYDGPGLTSCAAARYPEADDLSLRRARRSPPRPPRCRRDRRAAQLGYRFCWIHDSIS